MSSRFRDFCWLISAAGKLWVRKNCNTSQLGDFADFVDFVDFVDSLAKFTLIQLQTQQNGIDDDGGPGRGRPALGCVHPGGRAGKIDPRNSYEIIISTLFYSLSSAKTLWITKIKPKGYSKLWLQRVPSNVPSNRNNIYFSKCIEILKILKFR